MSTPSIVSFVKGEERVSVYVHHDGYPSVRGVEIMEFLDIVSGYERPLFDDLGAISARFVAYQFDLYFKWALSRSLEPKPFETSRVRIVNEKVESSDYIVDLGSGAPKATWLFGGKTYPLEDVLHINSKKLNEMCDEIFHKTYNLA